MFCRMVLLAQWIVVLLTTCASGASPHVTASCSSQNCFIQLTTDRDVVVAVNTSGLERDLLRVENREGDVNLTIQQLNNDVNTLSASFATNTSDIQQAIKLQESNVELVSKEMKDMEELLTQLSQFNVNLQAQLNCILHANCPSTTPSTSTTYNVPTRTTPSGSDEKWWKTYPIYQIYPRSFQDSDGDGTGDLIGIISRLDYLHDLGIRSIWLSPVYESPMADFGYDISNFTRIDPLFGTMADFNNLVAALHVRDMHLIMDFVPNHSSDRHSWFQQSLQGLSPYSDYYVWHNANDTQGDPPNNWLSVFGNSSWEWQEERNQSYLHQFLVQQPDLNYRSPLLRQEMENVLSFWMEAGVDGFRIDAVIFLVENASFPDEPTSNNTDVPSNEYNALDHIYTTDQPLTYEIVRNWSSLLTKFGKQHNKHIFSVTEGYTDIGHIMEFYDTGVDFPFNFNLIPLDEMTTSSDIAKMIESWMEYMPAGKWPNWVVGNHDNHRVATRMGGDKYSDVIATLLLLLPGTPTFYYGDEIGMTDVFVPFNETKDPAGKKWGPDAYLNYTRDPERTPMQWTSAPNAGFSNSSNGTWLPIAKNYTHVNVELQRHDPTSHLNIFKQLLALRLQPTFQESGENLEIVNSTDEDIFLFARNSTHNPTYAVVLDIGKEGRNVSVSLGHFLPGFTSGEVVFRTGNVSLAFPLNSTLSLARNFTLFDGQGLVLRLF